MHTFYFESFSQIVNFCDFFFKFNTYTAPGGQLNYCSLPVKKIESMWIPSGASERREEEEEKNCKQRAGSCLVCSRER